MSDVQRRIAITVIASAMALASTTVTTGAASAAPSCNAPAGHDCLALINATRDAHSFRYGSHSGSRCLIRSTPGKTTYYGTVHVPDGSAWLVPYKRDNCAGPAYTTYSSTTDHRDGWLFQRVRG